MNETDYKRIVERIQQSVANPMIATVVGLEAAQSFGEKAEPEDIERALVGGLAMHLHANFRLSRLLNQITLLEMVTV